MTTGTGPATGTRKAGRPIRLTQPPTLPERSRPTGSPPCIGVGVSLHRQRRRTSQRSRPGSNSVLLSVVVIGLMPAPRGSVSPEMRCGGHQRRVVTDC
jgi:hypothetical protein